MLYYIIHSQLEIEERFGHILSEEIFLNYEFMR